jgi:inorganic triphosphatase YgiF
MLEIETKLLADEEACLDRILALPAIGGLRVISRAELDQSDVYFDTPERDLAASRGSLRIRTAGDARRFTLKSGAVVDGRSVRTEIEEPAGSARLQDWVAALQASRGILPGLVPARLAPVLEIHNRRSLVELAGDGEVLIELAADRVRFAGPRGEIRELELELELKSGGERAEAELAAAAGWLRERYSLQPAHEAKYERDLRRVG